MKVNHIDDYDTHAIVGGSNIEDFAISQTAEFFTVLSSTLYSDKPLAVIREVLCNAWDAHKASNRRDIPVEVTVDATALVIRDYGLGIPHDLIHQIYCVYGNSTKATDGNQTGGFGLGSKAPFSYSDHFTVTNCHNGLKQVHAISRGSSASQGKPQRRVIVSVPTTEEGVEVRIPVKNMTDAMAFRGLVMRIASWGEMNVVLDGTPVDKVYMSGAEQGVFLTNYSHAMTSSVINVRYGDVIYPVYDNDEYSSAYRRLMTAIEKLPRISYNTHNLNVYLEAPPNSISVTPSRESLSITETTVKTLLDLFNKALDQIEVTHEYFIKLVSDMQREVLQEQLKKDNPTFVLRKTSEEIISRDVKNRYMASYYNDETGKRGGQVFIKSRQALANYYVVNATKYSDQMRASLLSERFTQLIEHGGLILPDVVKGYVEFLTGTTYGLSQTKQFMHKQFLRRLIHKLAAFGEEPNRLWRVTYVRGKPIWTPALMARPSWEDMGEFLTGEVVLTASKRQFDNEVYELSSNTSYTGRTDGHWVYILARKGKTNEAMKAFFDKHGFRPYSIPEMLSKRQRVIVPRALSTTEQVASIPAAPRPKTPKKVGLPALKALIQEGRFKYKSLSPSKTPRIENYTHVVKTHLNGPYVREFFPWGSTASEQIVELFGHDIAVCISATQYESQRKKGYEDGFPLLFDRLSSAIRNSQGLRNYVAYKRATFNASVVMDQFGYLIECSPMLQSLFGIPHAWTEDDVALYRLYNRINGADVFDRTAYSDRWKAVVEYIKAIPPDARYQALQDKLADNPRIQAIDLAECKLILEKLDPTKVDDVKTRIFIETTVVNALNN